MKSLTTQPEFKEGFLDLIILISEVNFASAFVEKIRIDVTAVGMEFIRPIAIQSGHKIRRIREGFQHLNCELTSSIVEWCNVAENYFQIIAYWGIFKYNTMMMEKIVPKTKDIETIYFENHLLANKIIDLKQTLEKNLGLLSQDHSFNGLESAKHTLNVISDPQEYELKK